METITFKIQGRHVSHTGIAQVFPFITTAVNAATEHFGWENANVVKRNYLGRVFDQGKQYSIHENYIDSGSDNYFYFAIEIID